VLAAFVEGVLAGALNRVAAKMSQDCDAAEAADQDFDRRAKTSCGTVTSAVAAGFARKNCSGGPVKKLSLWLFAVAVGFVNSQAEAAAPATGLAGVGALLTGGGLSLNSLPVVGGLLGAPGASSVSLYNVPGLGSALDSAGAVLPPLSGLPVVGALPVLGPLVGGNGSVSIEALPGLGGLVSSGSGGNVLTLANLPVVNVLYGGNPLGQNAVTNLLLGGPGGTLLDVESVLPVRGGLLAPLANLSSLPGLATVLP
jgi:hypothetical protein